MKGNLLYVAFVREDSEAVGFVKKIESQCKAFYNLNYNCYLYITSGKEAILYEITNTDKKIIKKYIYSRKAHFINNTNLFRKKAANFYRFNEFLEHIRNEIIELNIKNIYIRRIKPITPNLNSFLKYCKKNNIKVYYEFPDYPWYAPNPSEVFQYISYLYDRIAFVILKKHIDKVIGVSVRKDLNVKDTIIIKNGINLSNTPLTTRGIQESNNALHLVGVANVGFWHAYDRVIKGLRDYYNNNPNYKVYFHIVGDGGALPELRRLTLECGLDQYVQFHGSKTEGDLDEIINKCDIGIGILGNHRKNLFGDSSLKNREYCARGLPFIIAAEDYDFNDSFKYNLRIPADETNLDVIQVMNFFNKLKSTSPNYSLEMRGFAEKNLTWESKLVKVVEDFAH